ncbi:UNKNOWN [Stylonychia lemnae]|uniref:Transmembrane protein n=1 Tax=Stylonychia lemnae TaxID=5949 RepID=A0A078B2I8_STYLE|nr:UNKNOWN [Stylonychia lemnae]|eukprot:CDW88451.1 UNKNOWN [Stylonychia lemnae]
MTNYLKVQQESEIRQSNEYSQSRELQFFPTQQLACPTCISRYKQASYCLKAQTIEYCCSPFDNSTNCNTNSTNGVVCSPRQDISGVFINSYCKGASSPTSCGVDSLELIASDSTKTVNVSSLPFSVKVQNSLSYLACYYHIKPLQYTWKNGAQIKVKIEKAGNVSAYLFGGTSRDNASISIIANNATATVSTEYTVDASTEIIIVVNPNLNQAITSFTFSFSISGSQYSWWEKLIMGPNGQIYFWVAIGCGALIVFVLLAVIIFLIVRCCRKSSQVGNDDGERNHTDGSNKQFGKQPSLNGKNRGNPSSGDDDFTIRYQNENTTFDNKAIIGPSQGRPVIQKYDAAPLVNGPGGTKEDEYYSNPFLPQNIQKNKQNNMGNKSNDMGNRGRR